MTQSFYLLGKVCRISSHDLSVAWPSLSQLLAIPSSVHMPHHQHVQEDKIEPLDHPVHLLPCTSIIFRFAVNSLATIIIMIID